jgi:DNA-binding CsgD family transcriptional regulator
MKKKRTISIENNRKEIARALVTLFSGLFSLTEREQEVLAIMVEDDGKSDKKDLKDLIAKRLGISLSNVSQQLTSLTQKKVISKGNQMEVNRYFLLPAGTKELEVNVLLKIV